MKRAERKPKVRERKWSRDPAPIGTIRIRWQRRADGRTVIPIRVIKVSDSGPKGRRWIRLARWTWEQAWGPVPRGMRVVHADGDTLHDELSNYRLMTAGEVISLCHQLDQAMSEENRRGRKRREATARVNRERAMVNRAVGFLETRWYAVDRRRLVIYGPAGRSRSRLAHRLGLLDAPRKNGAIGRATRAAWPVELVRGADLAGDPDLRVFRRCEPPAVICRVCGCHEFDACAGGCYWVEPNLCSACPA